MQASLSIAVKVPNQYLNSDNWAMQQKMDGWRVVISTGDKLEVFNRDGHTMAGMLSSDSFGMLNDLTNRWVFDGEYVDGKTYIFDVLEIPTGDIKHFPLKKRLELLENLAEKFQEPIFAVDTAYNTEDKKKYFNKLQSSKKEGVIFKDLNSPYIEGRSRVNLKYKFTKNVDCIIIDKNIDDKDNFALGMFNNGEITEVGHCSALTGDGPKLKVGDVVQVNILYATKDNRLYQPVKPKLRVDRKPESCTLDQLRELLPDKEVVTFRT